MSSFRDLKAWQHAKAVAVACNKLSRKFPAYEQERGLAAQLRRAAASVALNIAEGANKASNRQFRSSQEIARTEMDEVIAIVRRRGLRQNAGDKDPVS